MRPRNLVRDNEIERVVEKARALGMAHRRKLPDMDGESLLADMQIDGVERAEVALAIEERWHFEPSEAELESWQSVGDIVACVERRAA